MNRNILFAILFMFCVAGPLSADIVRLKNGNIFEGEITAESEDSITLYLGVGTAGIARSEILSIQKRPWKAPKPFPTPKVKAPAAPEPDFWGFLAARMNPNKVRPALLALAGLMLLLFFRQKLKNHGAAPLVRYLKKISDGELLRMMMPAEGTYRDEEALALVQNEWLQRNLPPERVEKLKAQIEKHGSANLPLPAFKETKKKSGLRLAATLGLLLVLAGSLAIRFKYRFPAKTVEKIAPVLGTKALKNYPWSSGGIGYAQALKLQEETGAPMLLYFYATWCPFCRKFDSGILASPKVGKALAGVIKVKIDAEKESGLAAQYRIGGYPTVMAVHKSGWSKTRRLSTHVSPEDFIAECRSAGLRIN